MAAEAASKTDSVEVAAFEMGIRARVVEAQTMRVMWLADLSTRDVDAPTASKRLLGVVIDELEGH